MKNVHLSEEIDFMPDELPAEIHIDYSKARPNRFAANILKTVITITNEADVDIDDDMLPEYRFDYSKGRRNPYAVKNQQTEESPKRSPEAALGDFSITKPCNPEP